MNTPCPHVYEIEFDVVGQRREEYDAWIEAGAVEWITHEAIAGFEVFSSTQSLSPKIRFVFEFESLHQWVDFVVSDRHEAAMDRLRRLTSGLNATLWQRSGIRIDGRTDASGPDSGAETTDEIRTGSWHRN